MLGFAVVVLLAGLAAIPAGEDSGALFQKLMVWGLSMTIVGAVYSQLLIRVFAR